MGTFVFMQIYHVTLERISLGALIIALGILVDCAIVVTDGMRMQMAQGKAENILLNEPNARAVRNEWREKIKVIRPQIAETQARKTGIDRPEVAQAM